MPWLVPVDLGPPAIPPPVPVPVPVPAAVPVAVPVLVPVPAAVEHPPRDRAEELAAHLAVEEPRGAEEWAASEDEAWAESEGAESTTSAPGEDEWSRAVEEAAIRLEDAEAGKAK